jgi:hypothetical protein
LDPLIAIDEWAFDSFFRTNPTLPYLGHIPKSDFWEKGDVKNAKIVWDP